MVRLSASQLRIKINVVVDYTRAVSHHASMTQSAVAEPNVPMLFMVHVAVLGLHFPWLTWFAQAYRQHSCHN